MAALKDDSMISPLLPRLAYLIQRSGVVSSWPVYSGLIAGIILLIAITLSFQLVLNYYYSPLKSFPGPFWTNFTDFWRYLKTSGGSAHIVHAELHRKYGPAVRVGPNLLSLSDSALIKQVYNTRNPWQKSRMYAVQESVRPDGTPQPNLFSTTDEKWHRKVLQPVAPYLSSNKSVLSMESLLDKSIFLLLDLLSKKVVNTGRSCDIADWFLRFSWDAMGYTTFGSALGFLDYSLKDSDRLLRDSDRDFEYFARTSQMPWLHYWLKTNRIARALSAPQLEWAVKLSFEHYSKRIQIRNDKSFGSSISTNDQDFLDKYIEAQQKYPELVDTYQMISYLLTNTVAGSHPTAYTLTALVYYVLKTKGVYHKIRLELASLGLLGCIQSISYKQAKSLEYLDAVIREAVRIHPGFSLILERHVPENVDGQAGGFRLPDGRFVPSGTIVGMDAWVTNRDEEVFGPEPESFIPERWLPAKDESAKAAEFRRKKMFNNVLSFGVGPRVCLGQSLALVELYKTVASFFARFDIELAHPDQELKIINSWAMRAEDVHILLRSNEDEE